ncbi:MAG: ABC transporter ATP-binding protein [Aquabacterium sp.]
MSAPDIIRIHGLAHAWSSEQAPLFRLPELVLRAGESLFVHGPSGCGKSTLLSLLCGVLIAPEGEVTMMGQDWRTLPPSRRDAWRADHIGYIFQQFNLLPYLSPLDNVMLPCRFSRRRRAGAQEAGGVKTQAAALLRMMQLPESAWDRPSHQLSVGQQQRVAAARALVGRPSLVVADEPTSALDEDTKDAFMNTLMDASQRSACAVVFVSHDMRLASHFQRSRAWADLVEVTA